MEEGAPTDFDTFRLQEALLENQVLGQLVTELQSKLQVAERRAKDAEALRSSNRPNTKLAEQQREWEQKLEKLKRRSVNDRGEEQALALSWCSAEQGAEPSPLAAHLRAVLLEQALRAKEQLEQQAEEDKQRRVEELCEAGALRQKNAALQRQQEQVGAKRGRRLGRDGRM